MAAVRTVDDFEAQIRDLQQKRQNVGINDGPAENRVGLGQEGVYDSDIYEGTAGISRFEGYLDSIPATDDQEDEEEEHVPPVLGRKYTAPLNILNDLSKEERDVPPLQAVESCATDPSKLVFLNNWRKKTKMELVNPGSSAIKMEDD